MFFPHLTGFRRTFQYPSPKGCYHHPRIIEDNIEEIEVIVAGHGYFLIDGEFVDVGPGGLLWYYGGDVVEVTSHENDPYNTIVFEFFTDNNRKHERPTLTYWQESVACATFCKTALDMFVDGSAERDSLVACVYARLQWESISGSAEGSGPEIPEPLRLCRQFIAQHYQREIDMENVARKSGISVPHLYLLCRNHLGKTPLQLVLESRFQHARRLLISTNLSIKEIAFESGFTDFNNFCRSFKKHFGLTAREFRLQNRPSGM